MNKDGGFSCICKPGFEKDPNCDSLTLCKCISKVYSVFAVLKCLKTTWCLQTQMNVAIRQHVPRLPFARIVLQDTVVHAIWAMSVMVIKNVGVRCPLKDHGSKNACGFYLAFNECIAVQNKCGDNQICTIMGITPSCVCKDQMQYLPNFDNSNCLRK